MPRYHVEPPPLADDVSAVRRWALREFEKLMETLNQMVENPKDEVHVEPTRKVHGLIVLADGTNWNPGSGRGMYWYNAATSLWKFLG